MRTSAQAKTTEAVTTVEVRNRREVVGFHMGTASTQQAVVQHNLGRGGARVHAFYERA